MYIKNLKSFSKINLFLDVGRKIKKIKLHNIQSLIFLTSIHDKIKIKKNNLSKNLIKFIGKFSNNIRVNNTIKQSLSLLKHKGFIKKNNFYNITIKKNIPVFSGLGGGSGNAATIIKHFTRGHVLSKNDINYFSKIIGSDLRVFLKGSQVFQKNILEIRNVKKKYNFYFVLVYPFLKCSTKEIYSRLKIYKKIKNKNFYKTKSKIKMIEDLKLESNSLEKIVISKFPVIKKILFKLNLTKDCYFSRVTGSGSACFGLFSKKKSAELGLKKIKKIFPKFWCVVGKTI